MSAYLPIKDFHKNGVGVITLDHPKALNALNASMIESLLQTLRRFEEDSQIKIVILTSAVSKAFCAGGDVVQVCEDFNNQGLDKAMEFFNKEYEMDLFIHTMRTPTLCIASGFVMGGGVGIMQGCRYKAVTETTQFSMPETLIGFFPDVGASYFLNRVDQKWARRLVFTAQRLKAPELLHLGLANIFINSKDLELFIKEAFEVGGKNFVEQCKKRMISTGVQEEGASQNKDEEEQWGAALTTVQSYLESHGETMPDTMRSLQDGVNLFYKKTQKLFEVAMGCNSSDSSPVGAEGSAPQESEHGLEFQELWLDLQNEDRNLKHSCPLSLAIFYSQLEYSKNLSIHQVFEFEKRLVQKCLGEKEFQEGVRALLVDKDKKPQWHSKNQEFWKVIQDINIFIQDIKLGYGTENSNL